MDGVLNIRKPAGPTSHDVVHEVRRIFGQKRVGHAGTLDPAATGVLVICLGQATRIVEYLMGAAKEYRARLALGESTDTQDATGEVVSESDASAVTRETFEQAVAKFVGEIEQVPPMVSAVKHEGKPLYRLAREGRAVERRPRRVRLDSIEVIDFVPGRRAEAEIVVRCGSGTYIRTLCADIGNALGCGAHMSRLERTAVGRFSIDDSVTPEKLARAAPETRESFIIGMSDALSDMPAITVGADDVARIVHGLLVAAEGIPPGGGVRVLNEAGDLVAIGAARDRGGEIVIQPRKVLGPSS